MDSSGGGGGDAPLHRREGDSYGDGDGDGDGDGNNDANDDEDDHQSMLYEGREDADCGRVLQPTDAGVASKHF